MHTRIPSPTSPSGNGLLTHTHIKARVQNAYPIYDQNGQNQLRSIPYIYEQNGSKTIPFRAKQGVTLVGPWLSRPLQIPLEYSEE